VALTFLIARIVFQIAFTISFRIIRAKRLADDRLGLFTCQFRTRIPALGLSSSIPNALSNSHFCGPLPLEPFNPRKSFGKAVNHDMFSLDWLTWPLDQDIVWVSSGELLHEISDILVQVFQSSTMGMSSILYSEGSCFISQDQIMSVENTARKKVVRYLDQSSRYLVDILTPLELQPSLPHTSPDHEPPFSLSAALLLVYSPYGQLIHSGRWRISKTCRNIFKLLTSFWLWS